METNHKPNKKWRVYLILLALLCAIILFIVQIKKAPVKKQTSEVEIEVEIVQKDSNNVVQDSLNQDILPPSFSNNNASSANVVEEKKENLYPVNKENDNKPSSTKTIDKVSENTKNTIETKKMAIKEINLKLIKSANKPHSNYPIYNGGDEVLKGELYYLLKDNIVEQTVDKAMDVIEFDFTIDVDKTITKFLFKTNVSREIQKKIIRELDNLNDWNTQNFKGDLTYSVQLILL
jgi:hypothetical protein